MLDWLTLKLQRDKRLGNPTHRLPSLSSRYNTVGFWVTAIDTEQAPLSVNGHHGDNLRSLPSTF